MLLVVGGSLGSGRLNEVTRRFVADRHGCTDLAVRHVTGARDEGPELPAPSGDDRIVYQPVRYEDDMPTAYAAADVVLARAGATTVAELAALGLASILVPWPLAADDHQTANARVLADVGGALLVPDGELSADRLAGELARLADPDTRAKVRDAAASVGRRDGADPCRRPRRGARSMTAPPPLDLSTSGRFHVVGVGGPGMSALALVLAEMGHRVSGSDVKESPVLDRLRAAGVDVHVGHDRALVVGVDAVTASTAIPAGNIELAAARERGILTLSRAGMLASICARARSVAVAGTHGKTTTTSMLTMMLTEAGWHPSFVVGGDVNEVGTGAHWSGGEWLVVEADESDGTFLELPLHATVVTNVEVDHLEHFGSFDAIVAAFDRYLAGIAGPRVVGIDDEVASRFAARHDAVTYGLAAAARYRAVDVRREDGASAFVLTVDGEPRGSVRVPLRGLHNVRNATGALAMADQLGVPFDAATSALGALRRRCPPLRDPRPSPRCHPRRRLRPSPHGDRGRDRRGAQQRRRLASRGSRVPAEPLPAHGRAVTRIPRRVHRGRPGGDHRDLSVGRRADSGRERTARRRRGARRSS